MLHQAENRQEKVGDTHTVPPPTRHTSLHNLRHVKMGLALHWPTTCFGRGTYFDAVDVARRWYCFLSFPTSASEKRRQERSTSTGYQMTPPTDEWRFVRAAVYRFRSQVNASAVGSIALRMFPRFSRFQEAACLEHGQREQTVVLRCLDFGILAELSVWSSFNIKF